MKYLLTQRKTDNVDLQNELIECKEARDEIDIHLDELRNMTASKTDEIIEIKLKLSKTQKEMQDFECDMIASKREVTRINSSLQNEQN